MSKHTPKPWIVKSDRFGRYVVQDIPLGRMVASLAPVYTDQGQEGAQRADADANLLAAAPDLLAMCEELAECSDYWSEYDVPIGIVERLRAVIAKAKGEA